jgi:hypothetical protein
MGQKGILVASALDWSNCVCARFCRSLLSAEAEASAAISLPIPADTPAFKASQGGLAPAPTPVINDYAYELRAVRAHHCTRERATSHVDLRPANRVHLPAD